jgi:hypothetical protein
LMRADKPNIKMQKTGAEVIANINAPARF